MDSTSTPLSWYCVVLASIAALLFYWFLLCNGWRRKKTKTALPPGPPGWPIVGNLFQLGKKPNESLCALSLQYGPLMTLSLGMKTVVVVSSPAMAKEVFKTHDQILAGRTVIEATKILSHHKSSLIWAEHGPRWRKLRRIATTELFSHDRLQGLQHLRQDQTFRTIRLIFEDNGKVVNIGHTTFCTSLNLLGNMIFSTDVFDPHNPASAEFKDTVWRLMKLGGMANLADFFPFLGFLDPQGVCRQSTKYTRRMYDFVDTFIEKRLASRCESPEQTGAKKDFLDVLLDFRSEDFTLEDVRALIAELFLAGTETTTTTIEWAVAELFHNPQKMERVRGELDEVVGCNRRVEESDLEHLLYIRAVVKEIFRLHPTAPLLLPHKAQSSCEVAGFLIPKNSQVIANVWAIGRDPAIWKEPSTFKPERFLEGENRNVEYRGQNFELIPFGAGRRICPGLPLASLMVHLVLASLLHSFEWTHPDGKSWEEMDMSDEFALTLKKAIDLNAIPAPRLSHQIYADNSRSRS
uniref:TSA: Wollemia nobilis Ref_Wollemi_Transcript_14830_1974 transcribed RNA sequence n=1 Tax=Wollemia nobilis TaxID=56998 RepID=A0A0C9QPG7_9CONI